METQEQLVYAQFIIGKYDFSRLLNDKLIFFLIETVFFIMSGYNN